MLHLIHLAVCYHN